jgi:Cu(I)/Ag(I) efflux system membrane fusion protein
MKRIPGLFGALIALVIAGVIGYAIAKRQVPPQAATGTAAKPSGKVLYWYDPMTPQQHSNKPGLSPMGMRMVPRYADSVGGSSDTGIVRIDPATAQNLGLRTAVVKLGTLTRDVQVPATIAWNLREAMTVSARANGVLDQLYVRTPFESVKTGQPLAALVSPEWNAAALEYLALGNARSVDARALRDAARERLRALGMEAGQIRALRGDHVGIVLRAPTEGVVSSLDVREGQQVSVGMPLMTINGLDTVWLEAAIPQARTAGIGAGTPVTSTISSLPGEVFRGKVEALLPDVDPGTRTQRARIVLDNPQHLLAPGMFAQVRIAGAIGATHPLIPDEALISVGVDTRVIEAEGNGHFKPVAVRTGSSSDGMTEILAGLRGGERIVVSGQFLIDSEASLSGALERLSAPATSGAAASRAGPQR